MNDQRVAAFRKALTSVLESLDATVRVDRWPGPEPIPPPLFGFLKAERVSPVAGVDR